MSNNIDTEFNNYIAETLADITKMFAPDVRVIKNIFSTCLISGKTEEIFAAIKDQDKSQSELNSRFKQQLLSISTIANGDYEAFNKVIKDEKVLAKTPVSEEKYKELSQTARLILSMTIEKLSTI